MITELLTFAKISKMSDPTYTESAPNPQWWSGWFWGFIQGVAASVALAAVTLAILAYLK